MPKLNPYLIENKAQTEEVREINNEVPSFEEFMKNYEVDKKVVESYENEIASYGDISVAKGYGPCSSSSCFYSSNVRFYLEIGFSDKFVFTKKQAVGNWGIFYWITMKDIEQARSVLRKFESRTEEIGCYEVKERGGVWNPCPRVTRDSQEKQREAMVTIQSYIESHERGNTVYKPSLDLCNNGGCSGVIM